jgi:hypothetical protein
MSAILGKFFISLTVVLVTSQQGLKRIKIFVADQILIGRCFKGFEMITQKIPAAKIENNNNSLFKYQKIFSKSLEKFNYFSIDNSSYRH